MPVMSTTNYTSRHLLPLSSVIFNSKSNADLKNSTQSPTPLEHINEADEPDETITALPQAGLSSPTYGWLHKKNGSVNVGAVPTTPSAAAQKKSVWRRITSKAKKLFRGGKKEQKQEPAVAVEKPMVIGSPTGFTHVSTHVYMGLRDESGWQQKPAVQPVFAEEEEEWEDVETSF
ncbi:hypothetical protein CC80DRAFT_590555 [Byssothecium circinans]|uniref:Uncharacterized protein n=1 Tax=Byssothecium circinans TaxID=147558 RepID=A0A6A5U5Z7_9PLEO|nr:hypothetical protein CC80DRAFT_590555 [Byssothecium circinans]